MPLLNVTIGEGVSEQATAVGEWNGCSEVRGGSRRRRLSMGLPRMASVSPLAFITRSPRNTSKSQASSYVAAKSFQRLHPPTRPSTHVVLPKFASKYSRLTEIDSSVKVELNNDSDKMNIHECNLYWRSPNPIRAADYTNPF